MTDGDAIEIGITRTCCAYHGEPTTHQGKTPNAGKRTSHGRPRRRKNSFVSTRLRLSEELLDITGLSTENDVQFTCRRVPHVTGAS